MTDNETRTDGDGVVRTFNAWNKAVDTILLEKVGMIAGDMADYCSWDTWDCECTPIEGAWACMSAQDFYSFDDLCDLFGGCYE